jgi:NAD(P)-dependent dehydrogenase (short-subunit alcohol dehydrogenase family)
LQKKTEFRLPCVFKYSPFNRTISLNLHFNMSSSITNMTYIMIGGASGMGLATVQTLLARGAQVAVCDVSEKNLATLLDGLSPQNSAKCFARIVDVTHRSAINGFFHAAKERFGTLNGIANFAGTGGHGLGTEAVWQTTEEEYNFIMNLNVKGLFNVLSSGLDPGFLADRASVVHIGSIFSQKGFLNGAVFAASKHAALGMVRSAAKETEGRVRVNCVLP